MDKFHFKVLGPQDKVPGNGGISNRTLLGDFAKGSKLSEWMKRGDRGGLLMGHRQEGDFVPHESPESVEREEGSMEGVHWGSNAQAPEGHKLSSNLWGQDMASEWAQNCQEAQARQKTLMDGLLKNLEVGGGGENEERGSPGGDGDGQDVVVQWREDHKKGDHEGRGARDACGDGSSDVDDKGEGRVDSCQGDGEGGEVMDEVARESVREWTQDEARQDTEIGSRGSPRDEARDAGDGVDGSVHDESGVGSSSGEQAPRVGDAGSWAEEEDETEGVEENGASQKVAMSSYEQLRAENIARNRRLFNALGLSETPLPLKRGRPPRSSPSKGKAQCAHDREQAYPNLLESPAKRRSARQVRPMHGSPPPPSPPSLPHQPFSPFTTASPRQIFEPQQSQGHAKSLPGCNIAPWTLSQHQTAQNSGQFAYAHVLERSAEYSRHAARLDSPYMLARQYQQLYDRMSQQKAIQEQQNPERLAQQMSAQQQHPHNLQQQIQMQLALERFRQQNAAQSNWGLPSAKPLEPIPPLPAAKPRKKSLPPAASEACTKSNEKEICPSLLRAAQLVSSPVSSPAPIAWPPDHAVPMPATQRIFQLQQPLHHVGPGLFPLLNRHQPEHGWSNGMGAIAMEQYGCYNWLQPEYGWNGAFTDEELRSMPMGALVHGVQSLDVMLNMSWGTGDGGVGGSWIQASPGAVKRKMGSTSKAGIRAKSLFFEEAGGRAHAGMALERGKGKVRNKVGGGTGGREGGGSGGRGRSVYFAEPGVPSVDAVDNKEEKGQDEDLPISTLLMANKIYLESLDKEEETSLEEREKRRRLETPMCHGKCYCSSCRKVVEQFLLGSEVS